MFRINAVRNGKMKIKRKYLLHVYVAHSRIVMWRVHRPPQPGFFMLLLCSLCRCNAVKDYNRQRLLPPSPSPLCLHCELDLVDISYDAWLSREITYRVLTLKHPFSLVAHDLHRSIDEIMDRFYSCPPAHGHSTNQPRKRQ